MIVPLIKEFMVQMGPAAFAQWVRDYVEKTKGDRYANVGPPGIHLNHAGPILLWVGSGDSRILIRFWVDVHWSDGYAALSKVRAVCRTPDVGANYCERLVSAAIIAGGRREEK